jgi:hypothetical protein
MSRSFVGHASGGEFPQLVVHEWQQIGSSLAITGRNGIEQASHIGHSAECNRGVTVGNAKATV